KTYARAFKLQAVRMLTDPGLSVAEVARRLGVGENCLRAWPQAARAPGAAAFPGPGNPSPAEDELRRLRAEVQRLRAERDLLTNPPPTPPPRRTDLPVHRRPPRRLPGRVGLRRPGGVRIRLLRLGRPHPFPGGAAAGPAGRGDRAGPCRGEGAVRQPADSRRAERPRAR